MPSLATLLPVALAKGPETAATPVPLPAEASIAGVTSDLTNLPMAQLQHLTEVMPFADLVFGGGMLIVIVLLHAAGVRAVTGHVARRSVAIMRRPTVWRVDLLMGSAVFLLLALHLAEMFVWSSALVYGGLVPDWRKAGFFAGNTYTTVGYGAFVLPPGWEMLAPIIAISGLFTFGWSGSVLVDIVARCQRMKDLAAGTKLPTPGPDANAAGKSQRGGR
jgi:hypothetical protein